MSLAELASSAKLPNGWWTVPFRGKIEPTSGETTFKLAGRLHFISLAGGAPFLAGTQIQGLIVLSYPDYVFERWHRTMLFWAILM
ncbi:hypothetical protein ACHAPO_010489 [Fusarium lateritium]